MEQSRIFRRQEHKARSNLTRLTYTPKHRLLSKPFHLFCRSRSNLNRCMDRTRGNSIHPDAFRPELLRQWSSVGHNGAFRRAIVHNFRRAAECCRACGVDDAVKVSQCDTKESIQLHWSLLHVRKSIFGDGKHRKNVASKGALYLIQINVCQIGAKELFSSIVD